MCGSPNTKKRVGLTITIVRRSISAWCLEIAVARNEKSIRAREDFTAKPEQKSV